MVSSGNQKCVVWNCGDQSTPTDFEPGDWKKYVCVEPVSEWPGAQTLAPGACHELMAAVQAHLEEPNL